MFWSSGHTILVGTPYGSSLARPVPRQRLLVIHNPTAGSRLTRRLDPVLNRLERLGAQVTVRRTTRPGDAQTFAAAVDPRFFDLVVAAGGDGTINEVVNGLGSSGVPLAVLPVGTGNVLAAEVKMPSGAQALAHTIVYGTARMMFLGVANERRFAMMAGVGFEAHVVSRINPRIKRLFGKSTYGMEMLRGLIGDPPRRYRVTVDGRLHHAASVIVANGHFYGGRFVCAPDARLDEPDLHVCLFDRSARMDIARFAVALALGRLHRLADVRVVPAREISIDGPPGEPVQCDGDIATTLPLMVRAGTTAQMIVCGD